MEIYPRGALNTQDPCIYLLHFSHPHMRNQHYIHFTEKPLMEILRAHAAGKVMTTRNMMKKGFQLAGIRVWANGTDKFLKHLNHRGRARGQYCLVCHPKVKLRTQVLS